MKKRILALLMVLALCVGLAPAAWADPPESGSGGAQPTAGLYASYDPQTGALGSRLGGFQKLTMPNGDEVNGLLVEYTAGTARSVYYFDPNADYGTDQPTVNSNYAFVSVQTIGSRVLCITLSDAAAGYGIISVDFTNGGFPVRFDDASGNPAQTSGGSGQGSQPTAGLYASYDPQTGALGSRLGGFQKLTMPSGDEVNGLLVEYTAGTARSVYYFDPNADYGTDQPTVNSNYAFVSVQTIGSRVLCITLSDAAAGYGIISVDFTNGGFPVRFDDASGNPAQTSGGGNGNQNPLAGFSLVQAAGNASAVSVIPGGLAGDELIHPVKVLTVSGVDFYIGIRSDDDGIDDNPLMNKGMSFSQGDTRVSRYKVGFWVGEPNGDTINYWAVSQSQCDDLFAQCSGLQFSLLRMSDCTDLSPAFYRSDSAPARMALEYNYRTVGTWVPVLTGSFNGAAFTSYGAFGCHQYVGSEWEPDHAVTLDEVSAFLANAVVSNPDSNYFKVVLPYASAGYEGTITIPAVQGHLTGSFYIEGKPGPNGERQVIRGGVNAQGGTTHLQRLSFESPGSIDDTTNVCGRGKGEIRATDCAFTGYYRAMECDGDQNFKLGFENCEFIGNKTAVYMRATGYVSGDCHLRGSLFQNNEIALDLEQFSPMFGLHVYKVFHCRFINNRCDVKNCTGHVFFLPYNYFQHDITPAGIPAVSINGMIPCPFSTALVSAFPRALNPQFTAFDYSDPNPLLAIGGGVLIPINALAGKLMTMITQGSTPDQPDTKSLFWRFGA